eukprot:gnl/TRDRNA2_/TRDRNA2_61229_c0_seq1.p1 gnl/TRDRNA2_/TRDRNA2_61229_c0~~gnl/TRDRNA2_/TRDRNA2_61229_c0_seq1.p1  ORF type:complete len:537 (-),score=170.05 gnl/TRDRNA2_/TRDRNA2_61229_c0_seq1:39-1649(-)
MGDQQIDIQYDKAIEWLISRRKVKDDWASALRGAQAKVEVAKEQQLSDEAAKSYLAEHKNEEFDFFKIDELWKLLEKSDEGKKKNMLGQYTSPEVKVWKQAFDAYKRNNVFLADAAKIMVQCTKYDIPAAKNQAQACTKQVQDIARRQQDLAKREVEAKRRFREMCDQHGIPGVQFRPELQERVHKELPGILEEAANMIQKRCPAPLEFYVAFIRYTSGGQDVKSDTILPLVRFLIAKGNALLKDAANLNGDLKAEWKKVQDDFKKAKDKKKGGDADAGGISWAVDDSSAADLGGVNWDLGGGGAAADDSSGGGISWDFEIEVSGGGSAAADTKADVSGGIDWGNIDLGGIDLGGSGDAGNEVKEAEESADTVLFLANGLARGMLVDEVLELEAFLAQRKWELKERGGADATLETGNLEVQRSAKEVNEFHSAISEIVEAFFGKRTQSLLLMQSSDAALSHIVAGLKTQQALCEKPGRLSAQLEKRKAELSAEAATNNAEAAKLREGLRKMKARIEDEICTVMKHKVRIVGEVNTV